MFSNGNYIALYNASATYFYTLNNTPVLSSKKLPFYIGITATSISSKSML